MDVFSSFVQQIDKIFRLRVNVDPSLSLKLINEDGRLLPFPSPPMGTRSKKLLYFCQGMYRVHPTKQGNGNPTKGGLSLSLSPFHHGTMLSVRRTSALLRFSDSTRDFFPPLAPISSIRFNPSLPFSPLSPHHLSIVAATIVEQASWPTRIFDRRPLRSLWPKHMFSGGGCRSALSKALRWDR